MTEVLARAEAAKLKACLESVGVAVSVELRTGAGGLHWYIPTHRFEFSHHTVSRPSMGPTPCLGIVKYGRSDVPGPLANGYGGFDRVARLITMGRANHPGAGGPLTLDGVTIPKDNARPYAFGWEFEGGLEEWDEPMHDFMARCAAGTLLWLEGRGASVDAHAEHKTLAPGRKIDRLNYTRDGAIRRIRAVLAGAAPVVAPEEDDMPLTKEEHDAIVATRKLAAWTAQTLGHGGDGPTPLWWVNRKLDKLVGDVGQLLGRPVDDGPLSPEEVQQVAAAVLAGLPAETIAGAVIDAAASDAVAQRVADVLAARLAAKGA